MRKPPRFVAVLGSVAVALAFSTPVSAQEDAQAEEAVRNAFGQLMTAIDEGDMGTIRSLYSDDAVRIPPGEEVKDDLATFLSEMETTLSENEVSAEAQIRELHVSGSLAIVFATYQDRLTPKVGGETQEEAGRWASVWLRGEDGRWRLKTEIWNLVPAG